MAITDSPKNDRPLSKEPRRQLLSVRPEGFLYLYLVAALAVTIGIELASELAEHAGLIGERTEGAFNFLSMSIWSIGGLYIFLKVRDRSLANTVMLLGIASLFFSQLITFTDEFSALQSIPILGEGSSLNDPLSSASRVVGLGLLLASLFYTVLYLNGVREQLAGDHRFLAEKIDLQTQTETALRESEEKYRRLFDNANDIIYSIDLEGNFLSINQTAVLLTGFSKDEILRMNIADILVLDQVEMVRQMIRRRIEGTAPETYEVDVRTTEGKQLPLEISTRIQQSGSEAQVIQGIARDITERRRSEKMRLAEVRILERIASGDPLSEILEAQVLSLEELADGMIGSALLLDPDGKHLTLGAAPSLPQEYNDAIEGIEIGPKVGSCGTAAYLGTSIVVADIATDPLWEDFRDLALKFGLRSCWSTPILSSKSQVLGTFAMYYTEPKSPDDHHLGLLQQAVQLASIAIERDRDEKERRALEARIQQTQKMESLGMLAGGIAHDFNNLLTGVLGHASVALMDLPGASPVRDSLRQIEIAAARAADLAKQMLAYSGKGQFVLQPVDLSELVEEMAHLLETSISKRARIEFAFQRDLPAVEADLTQLRQVVMNLITNASEAIGDREGRIRLRTGAMESHDEFHFGSPFPNRLPAGNYAFLEVSDNGIGMDGETQARIFDPFFTTKFTGRGLGLSAVLGIVRGHGGDIRVYSEPGSGTTIRVMLPTSAKKARRPKAHPGDGSNGDLKGTVLVVDDEETVLQVSRRMLEKCGLEVLTACDGREGVETFRNHSDEISLVLLDMTMPHMGGEEAFEEIKRIRADARVVLSSGYNEQDAIGRFAGKGLAGFIQKPYPVGDLLDKVREALES
jgi:PAS domain S-box-containing protein